MTASSPHTFVIGMMVHVPRLRASGVIERVGRETVTVRIGQVAMRIRAEEATATLPPSHATSQRCATKSKVKFVASSRASENAEETIDLHGMRVQMALDRTAEAIDRALIAGLGRVSLIHGLGTGKILQALERYLPTLTVVKAFKRDAANPGVTHVYL